MSAVRAVTELESCRRLPSTAPGPRRNMPAMCRGVPPYRLLVVDAAHTVERSIAFASIQRIGLEVVFAESRVEALELLGTRELDAVVVVPPLGSGDAFAFAAMVRLRQPHLTAAILLGDGRPDGVGPRVVWMNLTEEADGVVAAVTTLAAFRVTPQEMSWWDEATTHMVSQ